MRRPVLGLARRAIALVATAVPAAAAVQVAPPLFSAVPGASAIIPITSSSQGSFPSGIQFDLLYDSAAISVGATLGAAAKGSGKSLYLADVGPGTTRFLIVGLNDGPIPDGPLVSLLVGLRPEAASAQLAVQSRRRQYSLEISRVVGSDAMGQPVATVGGSGSVAFRAANTSRRLPLEGVLNGATLRPGPIAPGEILTLRGDGIAGPALGETTVRFDGVPGLVLFAAPDQVNVVVPNRPLGKPAVRLRVAYRGEVVADVPLAVVAASPGVFTLDASGSGPGAIFNQNATVNAPGNPAAKGSIVSLFVTGAGGPAASDRLSTTPPPISVRIGGMNAEVVRAASAPAMPAGVLQIDCAVPVNAPVGAAIPILLTVGQASSQAGVTLAIR